MFGFIDDAFVRKAFGTVSPGDHYLANWHIRAICYELEKVMRRETKRLIITMPPRYLKSICASVAFPAWVLGHDRPRKSSPSAMRRSSPSNTAMIAVR